MNMRGDARPRRRRYEQSESFFRAAAPSQETRTERINRIFECFGAVMFILAMMATTIALGYLWLTGRI